MKKITHANVFQLATEIKECKDSGIFSIRKTKYANTPQTLVAKEAQKSSVNSTLEMSGTSTDMDDQSLTNGIQLLQPKVKTSMTGSCTENMF